MSDLSWCEPAKLKDIQEPELVKKKRESRNWLRGLKDRISRWWLGRGSLEPAKTTTPAEQLRSEQILIVAVHGWFPSIRVVQTGELFLSI